MLAAFSSGLGGELAKQWIPRILTPAFAFWAGGLAAVWWDTHGADVDRNGWARELEQTAHPLAELPALGQAVLVVGALALLAASAVVADRLTLPLLRLLEGYWSRPRRVRDWLVARRRTRRAKQKDRVDLLNVRQRRGLLSVAEHAELRRLIRSSSADPERLDTLQHRRASGFTANDAAELTRLQLALRRMPKDDALAMPTRVGDVLRAAERRPLEKYGLDGVVCWPALWLVMPDEAKTEIVQTRATLDSALRMWLWGALFVVWTPWAWWALVVALVVPTLAYYGGIVGAATLFGDLTVTAYDLYRMDLYDSLHLPRPASPADEHGHGSLVTNLLWGGLDTAAVRYVPPADGG